MLGGKSRFFRVLRAAAVSVALLFLGGWMIGSFTLWRWLVTAIVLVVGIPNLSYPDLPPEQEFARVAVAIKQSDNDIHGRKRLKEVRAELAEADLSRAEQCDLEAELAMQLVQFGDVDEAVRRIESAIATARDDPRLREKLPSLWRTGTIVYLRAAEQQNCVDRHCAQSCIFPIQRGGVHAKRKSAEAARRLLEKYLATNPPDAEGMAWLLNVINMTLGEYPDRVPPRYRLDPAALRPEAPAPRFVDIAPELGINRLSLAGGVAVADYDNDGRLDILSSTSDPDGPLALWHNLGDGHFKNIAEQAGLTAQLGGLNCQTVDYNNDGNQDIFVLRGGWFVLQGRIRNSLLRNNGDGTFTDVTREAGLADPAYPAQAAVWADFDNDGLLDVFVGNESLTELIALPSANFPSQLFHNNGDGTFTDVAARAGVANHGWVKGAAAGDYDNDGDVDLYISNHCLWNDRYGRNRLMRNNGDGTFTDVASSMGVVQPARSFATWFFDYDNDGWLDLMVCPYGAPDEGDVLQATIRDYRGVKNQPYISRLYHNDHGKRFVDVADQLGLAHPWLAMGASFGDVDNDGFLDIYLGTGEPRYEALVPNVMLRNDQARRFQNVTAAMGVGHLQKGHGVAMADFDNDGDQDLYADLGGFYPGDQFSNALFLNPGNGNHFLKLRLVGVETNRQAIGVRVTLQVDTPGGPREIHRASGIISSFGSHPQRLEIGLGRADRIVRLTIDWPTSGTRQTFDRVPLDALIRVTEGQTTFERLDLEAIDFAQHLKAATDETTATAADVPAKSRAQ